MIRESLVRANKWVFGNVEGWISPRIIQILEFAERYHLEKQVTGDVGEIGVHHGKLFFLLATLAKGNEKCIAVDLFDHQELNIDRSGKGSLTAFKDNMAKGFPDLEPRVRIVARDSLSVTPSTARDAFETTGLRLLSVDGGHTIAHAVNDLDLAQELLAPCGIVMLDDFFGVGWPGVSEGYFKYMNTLNRRLAPFLIFENKLFLTTVSEKEEILNALRPFIDAVVGDEIHRKWKYVQLSGTSVLCYFG
jgi:hypothetical protein